MQGRGTRFYGLDALRGVAALGVVFWHWQHFFFHGTNPGKPTPADLPLHGIFSLLYARGWMAVDLFFILSGFIFFRLYAEPIGDRQVSAWRFAWLRFSRLYPLHLLTLVLVAAIGAGFVYGHNDRWHFGLQLLFASSWGLEQGDSFNGPVWSVSVEVLVYALFYLLCRRIRLSPGWLLAIALASLLALKALYSPLGRGVGGFFLGGWLCAVYSLWAGLPDAERRARWTAWIAMAGWIATCAVHYAAAWAPPKWLGSLWPVLLFATTVLALALNEAGLPNCLRRLAWLGDISYSSYLLHFPLQLVVVLSFGYFGVADTVFSQPVFMLGFFGVLVVLSWFSHRAFEVPVQNRLRALLP